MTPEKYSHVSTLMVVIAIGSALMFDAVGGAWRVVAVALGVTSALTSIFVYFRQNWGSKTQSAGLPASTSPANSPAEVTRFERGAQQLGLPLPLGWEHQATRYCLGEPLTIRYLTSVRDPFANDVMKIVRAYSRGNTAFTVTLTPHGTVAVRTCGQTAWRSQAARERASEILPTVVTERLSRIGAA